MAVQILFEKDGVAWNGQTIGDSKGRILFGKDKEGALWIEIVHDNGGDLTASKVMLPDGKAVAEFLWEWFK